METIQGKKYGYKDILLYKVRPEKNDIVLFLDFPEQLKKFEQTSNISDAPVGIVPYTDSTKQEILSVMKKILEYKKLQDGRIEVFYEYKNEPVIFTATNEPIIREVMKDQRNYSQSVGEWTKLTSEDIAKNKKTNNKKLKKGMSVGLATILLASGIGLGAIIEGLKSNKESGEDIDNPTATSQPLPQTLEEVPEWIKEMFGGGVPISDTQSRVEVAQGEKNYLNKGMKLYNDVISKDTFILKYQHDFNITWAPELAIEVVEFINGIYPTTMRNMNEEDANAEMAKILQTIQFIIGGNLNSETSLSNIVWLANYIENDKSQELVGSTEYVARKVISESINEPMNGVIINSEEEMNKFSRQYINSVDQLLNYEYDTVNDGVFLTRNVGCRYLISSYFQNINRIIPLDASVVRNSSENTPRQFTLYYRYFFDDSNKVMYLARPTANGNIEYYAPATGEVYSIDVMNAKAGIQIDLDNRNTNVEVNPNIHVMGIGPQVDNRVDEAIEDLGNFRKSAKIR